MLARPFRHRVSRWLTTLSLAIYASVGVFGHALHGVLPCSDKACLERQAAESHEHCCSCHHTQPQLASHDAKASGPRFSQAGHDADRCALCTLLAKIKVGRVALYRAELTVAHSYHESVASVIALPAGLDLVGAPRGPPLA